MIASHASEPGVRRLIGVLARRPLVVTAVVVVIGAVAILVQLRRASRVMIEDGARRDAAVLALALQEVRTLYTREVVEPMRAHGVTITHDVDAHDVAIPLPATFSMKLAEAIGHHGSGASASLYSPFPFPWRAEARGELSGFAKDSWEALNERPEEPYWRGEHIDGRPFLRYAIADRMRAECIDCHNNHPATPRRGWHVGDVRGVLEVALPLEDAERTLDSSITTTIAMTGTVLSVAALGLWLGLGGVRRAMELSERAAEATASTNRELRHQIEEREKVELALRRSEERIRAVVRDSPAAIVSVDAGGRIVEMNRGAERMFACAAADMVGAPFHALLAAGYGDVLEQALAGSQASVGDVIGAPRLEAIGVRSDGLAFPLELSVLRWQADGEAPVFTAVIGDLTQRRRLQEEILETTQAERRRIGRDLHDSLGQTLVAVSLRARALEAALADADEGCRGEARQLAQMIQDASRQAQELSRGLGPADEDLDHDLRIALARVAEWTNALTRIDCAFSFTGADLPDHLPQAASLRAIAQEAVTNAVKHAGARAIRIELDYAPPNLCLRVRDDGRGMPLDRSGREGAGLRLMAQRAMLIGGKLTIESAPGSGTVVTCRYRRATTKETPIA